MDHQECKDDRTLDPAQLDVESIRQADIFYKWAKRAVRAKRVADELEFDLKVLEAKLQNQCRADPSEFGVKNVTEKAIQSAVLLCPKYHDAQIAYLNAREEQGLLDKATQAMDQRKRMIEVLVDLYKQQYFAGPGIPRDLVKSYDEHQQAMKARKRVTREA